MVKMLKNVPVSICLLALALWAGCANAPANSQDSLKTSPTGLGSPVPKDSFAWKTPVYDSSKKYIYLTFDDGPQHGTVECYQLCKQAGVKASFFMVGLHMAKKSDGKQIVSMIRGSYPQFLLANHSYTHANDKYLDFYHHPYYAEQDFYMAQDSLKVPFPIIRLPGNSAWVLDTSKKASNLVAPVVNLLDSAGFTIIGWDLEWHFNRKSARPVQSPEKLAAEVDSAFAKNQTHCPNHLVILSHDRMFQHPEEAEKLVRFIQLLKRNPAYEFETVDHYPGAKRRK